MTEVFAIYDKDDKLVVCFPTRNDAENYGKVVLGNERGWEYCIRKMYMYETKQYSFSQPLTPVPIAVPYTPPIPLKTTPYTPSIWCEGPKGPTRGIGPEGVFVDNGPFSPGTK
jgi:hypothetical protein